MKYISLFSGIGGLEHEKIRPTVACEIDAPCRVVLARRFPTVQVHDDVNTLVPPRVDVVVGGWPCQDLTSAGRMSGMQGKRSGLFFRIVETAERSGAHTLVAENVPNLLLVNRGEDFERVLETLRSRGFAFIAWRTLNSREFACHNSGGGCSSWRPRRGRLRTRCIGNCLELSRLSFIAWGLAKRCPVRRDSIRTAGSRGTLFNWGFAPALKIGAWRTTRGDRRFAVFFETRVRKLTAREALELQGFADDDFTGIQKSDVVRWLATAVSLPVLGAVRDGQRSPRRGGLRVGGSSKAGSPMSRPTGCSSPIRLGWSRTRSGLVPGIWRSSSTAQSTIR